MRNAIYITWGVWLIAGIVLKILGLIGWWAATSAIWFPGGVVLCGMGFIFVTADIGARLKRKREEAIPQECANCLFGRTCDTINATRGENEEKVKCIGEKIGGATRGIVCDYYERAK